jgi:hypothetical protein
MICFLQVFIAARRGVRSLQTLSESSDMLQDERSGFEIIDDFPFMLRLSKHSEPFSTACFTFEKRQELQRRLAPFKKEMIRLKAKIEQVLRHR